MQMEPTNPDTHIRGWDYPYYKHQIQSEHNFASSSAMLPYFQLDNCINGIFELSNTLFGLKFHFVEPDHGEVWHSSVKKVHVADADGALLGYLYLDLYSRAHKFGGSANFPIRLKSSHHPFARFALVTNFEPATKSSFVCFKPLVLS
jgi:Zn-dependent oligopeptidase